MVAILDLNHIGFSNGTNDDLFGFPDPQKTYVLQILYLYENGKNLILDAILRAILDFRHIGFSHMHVINFDKFRFHDPQKTKNRHITSHILSVGLV